jgi:hypothetical protein
MLLNTAYAYLAEQAEAADAVALPAYRVAQVDDKEIQKHSRRTALDDWLNAPPAEVAERDAALVKHLTS